ncbi:MAG: polysaccharide ABC transporter ATP-binding protein [bacterium]|nr:polysaccharide ABC transporter ATP-binding protein [bacterium]
MKKIIAEDLGIKFTKTRFKYFTMKEKIVHLFKGQKTEKFWALRHINFDVHEGETLGVIGPNGAGKSTLLKVVAGLMAVDEGKLTTKGKISTLLQLGAGFKPELSGRENIYVNANLLGYENQITRNKESDIINFADVEDFIDTPLKFYSSGMKVRLGFAVATAFDPEILLIDEILAVGDENFKVKCNERIQKFREGNKTIMVVSHNLGILRDMCTKIMLLEKGEKILEDEPKIAIGEYLYRMELARKRFKSFVFNTPGYEIKNIRFHNEAGEEKEVFTPEEKVRIIFDYKVPPETKKIYFRYLIFSKKNKDAKEKKVYEEVLTVKFDEARQDGTMEIAINSPLGKHGQFLVSFGIMQYKNKPDYHIFHPKIGKFSVSLYKDQDKDSELTLSTYHKIIKNE